MEHLFNTLNTLNPLSQPLIQHLSKILKVERLSKKQYLLQPGEVCSNVYFVEKGLLRCFYREYKKEITSWFMREHDVIFSVVSFYTQTESYEYIQALEDCVLYYISYDELQDIYDKYREFDRIGRVLTEKYYLQNWRHHYYTHMKSARSRYEYMLTEFPELVLRVPNKYLASYMGVAPATLSRIRAGKKN